MKTKYNTRQEMSKYKLKNNIGFQVNYTMEDLQEALKNKEISEKDYNEKSKNFELR